MIASENIVSDEVLKAMGSVLTNKYAEGYPGRRYYGGCQHIDEIEDLARQRAYKLFGADHANVQPHSGANANLAAMMALMKPGDTFLGMGLAFGGHLSHGAVVNISSKIFNAVQYGTDSNGYINYDNVRDLAKQYHPKLILAGASSYPRFIDFAKFREIADEIGAYLLVDMAHIAGLVAAGVHPSPIPYADVVTTTTHKTLRGPRGGMILCKQEFAKRVDSAVFPCTQGGPLEHIIAAKAVCFGEALRPDFKTYGRQIVKNASALANNLVENGFNLITGGTDNHLILADLRNFNITGKDLQSRLDEIGVALNKNAIPNDPQKPTITSGVRIGTPAITTRGFKEDDMKVVANIITSVAKGIYKKDSIREEVQALCLKYPIYTK